MYTKAKLKATTTANMSKERDMRLAFTLTVLKGSTLEYVPELFYFATRLDDYLTLTPLIPSYLVVTLRHWCLLVFTISLSIPNSWRSSCSI